MIMILVIYVYDDNFISKNTNSNENKMRTVMYPKKYKKVYDDEINNYNQYYIHNEQYIDDIQPVYL
jgi:hypothetical protein